jgi:endonuclease YncB( thermonuclease family)
VSTNVKTWGPYSAKIVDVHDGDTLFVDILLVPSHAHLHTADTDLGFNVHHVSGVGVVLERQSVRLLGCNAPELETQAGKDALAFILTVVSVDELVTLVSYGWDKYGGRIDGAITLPDGRVLSQVMIDAGHAVAWDGLGVKPGGSVDSGAPTS